MAYASRVTTQRNTLIETPWTIDIGLATLFTGVQTETMFKQNIDFTDINQLYCGGVCSEDGGNNYNIILKIDTTTKFTQLIDAASLEFLQQVDCSAISGSHDLEIQITSIGGGLNSDSYARISLWGCIA